MQERKYRGIGWHVSENGRKLENLWPGLGFFFIEGEKFSVTPFMQNYKDVTAAIKMRRNQLKSFGKGGTVVFDIESNYFDKEGIFGEDAY